MSGTDGRSLVTSRSSSAGRARKVTDSWEKQPPTFYEPEVPLECFGLIGIDWVAARAARLDNGSRRSERLIDEVIGMAFTWQGIQPTLTRK